MEPLSDSDEWLFDAGPAAALDGRGAADDGQLDVLDDLFTLLMDSSPPRTGTATAERPLVAPTRSTAAPSVPGPAVAAAAAASSPLSSSGQSAHDEDGDGSAARSDQPPPPARSRKRRKRPKDELDYLRGAVSELEQQLSALRSPEPPQAKSDPSRADDAEWEEVARHQRREAEQARATNAQLRSMLEGQLSVAQQLQQALQQHLKMARIEGMDAAADVRPPVTDALANPQLLEELTAKLDDLYTRVDAVVASTDFAGGVDSALKTSDRGTYFEISNARRLPFSVAAVNRAMWRSIALTSSPHARGWVRRLGDGNTLHFGFTEPFTSAHLPRVTISVRSSIRRYIEPARIVSVWSSVIEIEGSMYVRLREDGWSVSTPETPPDAADTADVSLLHHVVHVTPEVANAASAQEQRAHVGEMTDLVLGTYRRLMRKVNQTVENLLVADAFGAASSRR